MTDAAPEWACGLLAVDKPTGVTSHDVVERVRRRLHVESAGHLGTLDPAASGLLLVALGPATRFVPALQGGEKTYEARMRFGIVTSTQDLNGEVLSRSDDRPAPETIRAASAEFVGEIDQIPPMASALKVAGQRLHRLHRRGVTVERAPRRVTVRAWEWISFEGADATFRVRCLGGTYVRTLAHDLGQRLGSGAALAALRRLRSEPFGLERSASLARIVREPPDACWKDGGYTLDQATAHLPGLGLEPAEADAAGFGRRPVIARERARGLPVGGGARSIVLRDARGAALGLGELAEAEGGALLVCPHVLMPWAVRDGRLAGGEAADGGEGGELPAPPGGARALA
jgi:tRNA pseudouridine55 synthase